MKVRIKKLHPNAVIPAYAKEGDAGMDLTATEVVYDKSTGIYTYHTGLSVEIPIEHVGFIFPRSSISKTSQSLVNCVGIIDSGYRGEILVKMTVFTNYQLSLFEPVPQIKTYSPGDRVAQLIILPYPLIEFEEVEDLSKTERSEGGFGSTGK